MHIEDTATVEDVEEEIEAEIVEIELIEVEAEIVEIGAEVEVISIKNYEKKLFFFYKKFLENFYRKR